MLLHILKNAKGERLFFFHPHQQIMSDKNGSLEPHTILATILKEICFAIGYLITYFIFVILSNFDI